ncbi:hypothetical protein OG625_34915 [Streptomyces sp. NBC_01351]|uniref:hypothetical protein n=1 Tax=Streptomyces sp. NBC_01351 TaxID=2903833 RepID=UPI002E337D4A|nr:hypothetical protein [Streptomyces sp. NBC_01351]
MRRAAHAGTRRNTGKRWSVPGLVGMAGGAAVLGFGGLYAAGPLLAGDDVAPARRCAVST